ncbi:alcohol dehydrogenase catalytic domain-containing protein [Streptomyces justiciae]|uniref:alcohol dehydrogenase catalytic domain-containing protein n=1 Tax=Streptomyces justiciae TaxID=2780140 RepID=UPI001D15AFD6|nr:alcohol dehydrogenase catalytic domain-containing protein [Streptomyces justiciae]
MAFSRTGGPEVLHLVDLPTPTPGPGEILLRVAYAGVNYGEIQHRLGDFGEPAGETVTGLEAAGVVAAVGEGMVAAVGTGERVAADAGVADVRVGDRVAAYLPDGGGYAEYTVVPAAFAFPLPDALDLRSGGGAALVLTTAYGVLAGAARLAPSDTVLIHAAAGGVGGVAAQLARAGAGGAGGVRHGEHAGEGRVRLRRLRLRRGLRPGRLPGGRAGGDRRPWRRVVLDPVGGPTRLASLDVLAPFGRVAVYGEAARHPDLHLPVLPL